MTLSKQEIAVNVSSVMRLVMSDCSAQTCEPSALAAGPDQPDGAQMMMSGGIGIVAGIVGIVVGIVILMGALKMKKLESYGFSMAAAILAALPCISPCCLIGLPIGIWAVVVLNKPEVKSTFR